MVYGYLANYFKIILESLRTNVIGLTKMFFFLKIPINNLVSVRIKHF
jgi:hypothetical protein